MENIIQIEGIVENLQVRSSRLGLNLRNYRQRYVKSRRFTCTVNGYSLQGNFQELMFGEGSNVRIVTYKFDDVSNRHHIDAILNLDNGILHMPAWMGYGCKALLIDLCIFFPLCIWLSVVLFFSALLGFSFDGFLLGDMFAKLILILYVLFAVLLIPLIWSLIKADKELLFDLGFSQPKLALQRMFYFHKGRFKFEHSYGEVYVDGKYCHGIHDCKKLVEVYPDFKLSDVYMPKRNSVY